MPSSWKSCQGSIQGSVGGQVGEATPVEPPPTPVFVSNVEVLTNTTGAQITWTTNIAASSAIYWGLTDQLEGAPVLGPGPLTTSHDQTITGSVAETLHYFRVASESAQGAVGISDLATFTTDPLPVLTPNLTNANASGVTEGSATLTCVSDNKVDGDIYVAVRTSGPFDANDAQLIIDGVDPSFVYATSQAVSDSIAFLATGLAQNTTHYYAFVQDGVIVPLSNVLFEDFLTLVGAPVLSAPTSGTPTATSTTLGCTSTDTTNGRVYCSVRTSGAYGPGDAAIIISGAGAVDSLDVAASAPLVFPVSGLTPETVHYYGFVQDTDA